MATTITISGTQLLTSASFDAVTTYAPNLQTLIFSSLATSKIITDELINKKSSLVYDVWSSSAPFDPASPPNNFNFTSNTGSTLSTTRTATKSTMSILSGNKNVNFFASTENSGDNIFNNDGTYKDGTFIINQKINYADTKGTTSQQDDTSVYSDGSISQSVTVKNGQTNLELKFLGSQNNYANEIYTYMVGATSTQFTITGSGANSVWTPHSGTNIYTDYKYFTGPNGFGLSFSGTENINFDTKTDVFNLSNVTVFDPTTNTKITAAQATITLTNVNPNDVNLGLRVNDDLSAVKNFVDVNLTPVIRDAGVVITTKDNQASTLIGGANKDIMTGGSGNDAFFGKGANDVIDGAAGFDVAKYLGASNQYQIISTNGSIVVSDNTSNRDGVDTLTNVERLQFSDKVVGFDVSDNAGEAYRIYEAAFNRKPDTDGLGYWIAQLDKGATLKSVAEGFIGSSEFQKLYGSSPSNTSFVDNLYKNILDRAGEKAGVDYWVGQLNSGVSRADILVGFSESAENKAGVIGSIQNGIEYKEWLG
jgi:hypothetical protein